MAPLTMEAVHAGAGHETYVHAMAACRDLGTANHQDAAVALAVALEGFLEPTWWGTDPGWPALCDVCHVPLDSTDGCPSCGVYHGDPCEVCGRRGYHADDCADMADHGVPFVEADESEAQAHADRCPKIPAGYGTDPRDCACGACPEARR